MNRLYFSYPWQVHDGKRIFDIGITPKKRDPKRSPYYRIERQTLINAGHKQIFLHDISFHLNGIEYILKLYEWVPPK